MSYIYGVVACMESMVIGCDMIRIGMQGDLCPVTLSFLYNENLVVVL